MAASNTPFRDTEQYKLGHTGELRVAEYLCQRGWYVIPSYDYTGDEDNKAPRLQGSMETFVIPDLDIAKNGNRRWAEVKTKTSASYTHITGRYEHGVPRRHYDDYLRVQQITGCEVWLFIVEQNSGKLLLQKLDDLRKRERRYDGNKMSRGGMVFFPRDAFIEVDLEVHNVNEGSN